MEHDFGRRYLCPLPQVICDLVADLYLRWHEAGCQMNKSKEPAILKPKMWIRNPTRVIISLSSVHQSTVSRSVQAYLRG